MVPVSARGRITRKSQRIPTIKRAVRAKLFDLRMEFVTQRSKNAAMASRSDWRLSGDRLGLLVSDCPLRWSARWTGGGASGGKKEQGSTATLAFLAFAAMSFV
jgi:hypothetical protein